MPAPAFRPARGASASLLPSPRSCWSERQIQQGAPTRTDYYLISVNKRFPRPADRCMALLRSCLSRSLRKSMLRDCGPAMNGMWPQFDNSPISGPVRSRFRSDRSKENSEMLRGSLTALITPFADGALDEKAFSAFVDWQIGEGTQGLIPVGTTGESPAVSHEEHRRVVEICVDVTAGRVPVVAGAGSNSTAEAISLARFAEEVGADAILSVVPYYNRPNQEGLFQHFSAIASATGLPIVLYSVPGRTVVDLTVDTIARLRDAHDNIIAVKDATSNMERASQQRAKLGPDFILLSGEDMTALGFNAHGGSGCISVTSNVAPRLCAQFQN